MVHWPEVMVTYDEQHKLLFSADAFGTFGALAGNIFDDEINFDSAWMNDARRYYTNIVGKYGAQVQALLKRRPRWISKPSAAARTGLARALGVAAGKIPVVEHLSAGG